MKRIDRKSHCPINFALETFGDTWSLLIVRDIINDHKTSYGEFLDSEEKISTNILADRLTRLEEAGIIRKKKDAIDKRKDRYALTQKGIDLYPMMVEMVLWSAKYDSKTIVTKEFLARAKKDKEGLIQEQQDRAKNIVIA
jgi:DNA-binding HxlR family transcriptional regulator